MRTNSAKEIESTTQRRCPICNGEAFYVFTSKHEKDIFECCDEKCSHFFTDTLSPNQGVCTRDSDLEAESNQSLKTYDERNGRLLQLLLQNVYSTSMPMRFLDYGAGNAHISRSFKKILGRTVEIYCLEANPACQELFERFELKHLQSIENVPARIDLVYMVEVIEHLNDPVTELVRIRKKLSRDGLLFFQLPPDEEMKAQPTRSIHRRTCTSSPIDH